MKKSLLSASLLSSLIMQSVALPAYANKEAAGTIIGGLLGGLIGNSTSDRDDRDRNTAIGAIIGAFIGNRIGADMDERDRKALAEAQRRALESRRDNEQIHWQGSDYGSRTGAHGSITSIRTGQNSRTGEICREYESTIITQRGSETTRGIACYNRSQGTWYETQQNQVRFEATQNQGYQGGVIPGPSNQLPGPSGYNSGASRSTRSEVFVANISRRSGGEVVILELLQPLNIQHLEIHSLRGNVTVHSAILQNTRGEKFLSSELSRSARINQGFKMISENLLGIGRVRSIEIRAESMGRLGDIRISATSLQGTTEINLRLPHRK